MYLSYIRVLLYLERIIAVNSILKSNGTRRVLFSVFQKKNLITFFSDVGTAFYAYLVKNKGGTRIFLHFN